MAKMKKVSGLNQHQMAAFLAAFGGTFTGVMAALLKAHYSPDYAAEKALGVTRSIDADFPDDPSGVVLPDSVLPGHEGFEVVVNYSSRSRKLYQFCFSRDWYNNEFYYDPESQLATEFQRIIAPNGASQNRYDGVGGDPVQVLKIEYDNAALYVAKNVAFWETGGDYLLACPSDAAYLLANVPHAIAQGWAAVSCVPQDDEMHKLVVRFEDLWEDRIVPILEQVFALEHVPCSQTPASTDYWGVGETEYFSLHVMEAEQEVFVTQHCGVTLIERAEFISQMSAKSEWIRVDIDEQGFRFSGTANTAWQILLK